MTTRTDVTTDYIDSPRIIEVAAPSTEMTMQDLVDTGRIIEHSFQGLSYYKLLNASGKNDLGGGTKVGITVALQDAKLAFEGRTDPAEVGTITSVPPSLVIGKEKFVDSSALFITNGVTRGSLVINFTDMSIADVISVDSETQLTTKTLVNGTTNTYNVGDDYQVFNIEQVRAVGGNLTAVDANGDSISPILPTAFTQVLLTASSSATLQEQSAIQYSSFGGGVTIDVTSEYSGIEFPIGTPQAPVNNISDAHYIASERGFPTFYIIGNLHLTSSIPNLQGHSFIGSGKDRTLITIDSDANVEDCAYYDAEITGTLDGNSRIKDCIISNLIYVKGFIEQCVLSPGTIVLAGSEEAHFLDCWSGQPGVGTPIIDMGGSGQALALRNYNGGIKLTNKTGTESVSIDLNSGQVILSNTVSNGTVVARGVGKLIDELGDSIPSGDWNGTTILNETVNSLTISSEVWGTLISDLTDTTTIGGYIARKLLTLAKYIAVK